MVGVEGNKKRKLNSLESSQGECSTANMKEFKLTKKEKNNEDESIEETEVNKV